MPARRLFASALLVSGAGAVFFQYREALAAWFFREDSRYFSNGLFSFWDLILAFAAPRNEMGHYRPITKLLWGAPQWLGLFGPLTYHAISLAILALAALALARLSFLLFGDPLVAALTGILWALLPVNAKPVYWLSAGQDLTCALFVFSMLVFRIEQWRDPAREKRYRALCLLALAGALFSREVGFAEAPLLLLVDAHYGRLRRSWETLWLPAALAAWIFVVNPPFAHAHVSVDASTLFSSATPANLWNYAVTSFWATADGGLGPAPAWIAAASGLSLFALLAAPFLGYPFLLASGLAALGIAPFLLINVFSIEYAIAFGAGTALVLGGLLVRATRRLPPAAVALAGLATIGAYLWYLAPSRAYFREAYVGHSLLLRDFFTGLGTFTRALPPYRPIEIVDFGPYRDSPARDTHHFIAHGLDELIPDRVILFHGAFLGIPDGTLLHDPTLPFWGTFPRLDSPTAIRYTERGFRLD